MTDLSPGGMITPGYLALFMTQYGRLGATFLISLLCYISLLLFKRFFPLYGRRQYALAICLAVLFKLLLADLPVAAGEFSLVVNSIGFIVPGLMANDMEKQGIGKTALSIVSVAIFLFAILLILKRFRL